MRAVSFIIIGVVALPFAFGGLLFTAFGIWQLYEGAKTDKWVGTSGTITETKIIESTSRDSDGHSSSSFEVKLRYEFIVDGETYEGHRIQFGGLSHNSRADARAQEQAYPVGQAVEVFHDPAKPANAVLVRGTGSGGWIATCVGIGVMLFSLCLAIFVPKIIAGKAGSASTILNVAHNAHEVNRGRP
jgi:hypothetical protein